MKKKWFEYLESLDRRIIYVVLLGCLILPYMLTCQLPMPMDTGAKGMFETIERLARLNEEAVAQGKKPKIAVICTDFDAGTKAENHPQTVAVMAHLYQRNIPFAIVAFIPEGPRFARLCIEDLKRMGESEDIDGNKVDYREIEYGVDYCEWGYKLPDTPIYRALAVNLYSIVEADAKGTPIRDVPMMKDVESMHDIGFVFHAAGSAMIQYWIQYVQPQCGFDLGSGATGIMGPEFAAYLHSGQLTGLLTGMTGAYMYEQQVKIEGLATVGMSAQNFAHVWVIIAMLLGNIGYILLRRKKAQEEEKGL